MTPAWVVSLGLIVGIVVASIGAVWNATHAYRHRVGRLAAMRMFLLGVAILIATPGAAILAIPDRPFPIAVAAALSMTLALAPVAIALRLRVRQ